LLRHRSGYPVAAKACTSLAEAAPKLASFGPARGIVMITVSTSGALDDRTRAKANKARSYRIGLDFPRELEAEYQGSILEAKMRLCRLGAILGLILNVVYTVWDSLVFEAAFERVTLIRQVYASAFLIFAISLTYLPALRTRTNELMAFILVGYAAFFGYINTLEQTPYIFIGNGTIISFFAFLFMAGSLRWMIGASLATSAVLLGIVAAGRGVDRNFVLLVLLDVGMTMMGTWFAVLLEGLRRQEFLASRDLAVQRQRFRQLLVRILPESIADRLQEGEAVADKHQRVVVMFADIVGFTEISSRTDPEQVVAWLNALFASFDNICDRHKIEKIKTIGDAYMAAQGLGESPSDCEQCVRAAIEMIKVAQSMPAPDGTPAKIRIGLNLGPCYAGIIGERRFLYDLWGDTVNVASRMEAAGVPNAILVTDEVRNELANRYDFQSLGQRDIKGRGLMNTWVLPLAH
jgi:adenylate cyclase